MNLTLTNRPHIVESFVNHDELASSFLKLKIKKMNLFEIVRDDEKSKQTNKDLSDVAKSKQITYGYCKVCHDVAYGIHFGIPACNGCKVRVFLEARIYFDKMNFIMANKTISLIF